MLYFENMDYIVHVIGVLAVMEACFRWVVWVMFILLDVFDAFDPKEPSLDTRPLLWDQGCLFAIAGVLVSQVEISTFAWVVYVSAAAFIFLASMSFFGLWL